MITKFDLIMIQREQDEFRKRMRELSPLVEPILTEFVDLHYQKKNKISKNFGFIWGWEIYPKSFGLSLFMTDQQIKNHSKYMEIRLNKHKGVPNNVLDQSYYWLEIIFKNHKNKPLPNDQDIVNFCESLYIKTHLFVEAKIDANKSDPSDLIYEISFYINPDTYKKTIYRKLRGNFITKPN